MRASLCRPLVVAALLAAGGLAGCGSSEQVIDTSAPPETQNADASSTPEVPFPTPESAPEAKPADGEAAPPAEKSSEAAPESTDKPAAPQSAAADTKPAEKPGEAKAEDYYTKRANDTLKADAKAADKQHPLAAGHPDYFVTVCEAGCSDERAPEIVAMERKVTHETVRQGMMVPTSGSDEVPATPMAQPQSILCIGGCFDGMAKSFPARAVPPQQAAAAKSAAAQAPAKRDPLSPVR